MKKKYRNRLPKGAEIKGYIAHVSDGEIIVEVELKDKFEPKDGDFLIDTDGDIFIYSDAKTQNGNFYSCYCGTHHGKIRAAFCYNWVDKVGCRFAMPEEKSAFLERLEAEEHLRWNADTKKLEPIRWRAERNGIYWFIDPHGRRNRTADIRSNYDNDMYEIGNYFRTPEAAQKVADQIKDIFKNAKAE